MSKVRTSAYRRPPTPSGLKAIEEGTLEWFDTEMFSNFNTEVLEEYLDEKNRAEGFGRATWKWNQAVLGLIIGIFFAVVNQYVGLKVGMVVSGSWYVAYLSAMAMRWKPGEVNISAATSTSSWTTSCPHSPTSCNATFNHETGPRWCSGSTTTTGTPS